MCAMRGAEHHWRSYLILYRFLLQVMRNAVRREAFMRKTMNTNPARGHRHHRAPAKVFERTIRGMLPHKTPRGGEALSRLRCYEGVPEQYAKVKRVVVPAAYRVSHLRWVLRRRSEE